MRLTLLACLFLSIKLAYSQKPSFGTKDLGKWHFPIRLSISDDGRYSSFVIYNKPQGSHTLVLNQIDNPWSKEYVTKNVPVAEFSKNGQFLVTTLEDSHLLLLRLRDKSEDKIPFVTKHLLFKQGKYEWLAYLTNNGDGMLTLRCLDNQIAKSYFHVNDFFISKNGNMILVKENDGDSLYILRMRDLANSDSKLIYRGSEPRNVLVDEQGQTVFFSTEEPSSRMGKKFWCFDGKSENAQRIEDPLIDSALYVESIDEFSEDGTKLYCTVRQRENQIVASQGLRMNILTYVDPFLNKESETSSSKAVWYVKTNMVVKVLEPGEYWIHPDNASTRLVRSVNGHYGEWNWNENARPKFFLLDLSDGSRRQISSVDDGNLVYTLSPSAGWVVYFNAEKQAYYSYNTHNGVRRCLTERVVADWTTFDRNDIPMSNYITVGGYPMFSADEKEVFLYDQHDIYKVSLIDNKAPVNITKGYGKLNNIVFRFAFLPNSWESKKVILTAFNRTTKEDGFYSIDLERNDLPLKLTMGPYVFTGPEESKYFPRFNYMPIKARNASVYLVQMVKENSAPNVYVTKDFKHFSQLSDIHPEKQFNWYTTELVTFKSLDGIPLQGVLYKPENFDSKKKYPIIFHYYEKVSECLNMCLKPAACEGPMNIPYFVSNGYLVFTPDIRFKIGHPGMSSFNAIMGAANELIKRSYIDSTKMGLQGHSFGGFQTNYIITHTSRFSAACSAAGFTNFVSAYGAIFRSKYSRQGQYELDRDRMGVTLWEKPDWYLENSPVLRIDKVTTPLLMMHNNDDDDVPVTQGMEFYTGLRRLGKVSYLLQYSGYEHSVFGDAAIDYSRRMMDFFDYYLKGSRLPDWMTDKPSEILRLSLRQN